MAHQPEIGIETCLKRSALKPVRLMILRNLVESVDCACTIPFNAVCDVSSAMFDHCSEPRHPIPDIQYPGFLRMQHQTALSQEPITGNRNKRIEELPVVMHHHHVIHIPTIPAQSEIVLHEMVEPVQVEIGEQLACQVPDGQTVARLRAKHALVVRQSCPVRTAT